MRLLALTVVLIGMLSIVGAYRDVSMWLHVNNAETFTEATLRRMIRAVDSSYSPVGTSSVHHTGPGDAARVLFSANETTVMLLQDDLSRVTSILRDHYNVTFLQFVGRQPYPTATVVFKNTSTSEVGFQLKLNRSATVHYVVMRVQTESPQSPAAPTRSAIMMANHGTGSPLTLNSTADGLVYAGVYNCERAFPGCNMPVISLPALQGALYRAYTVTTQRRWAGNNYTNVTVGNVAASPLYTMPIATARFAASTFSCATNVVRYSCLNKTGPCTQQDDMTVACTINVSDTDNVAGTACVAGEACMGHTSNPGWFTVTLTNSAGATVDVTTKTHFYVASTYSADRNVVSGWNGTDTADTYGRHNQIEFTFAYPYNTAVAWVNVSVAPTGSPSAIMVANTSDTALTLYLRTGDPDTTTTLVCTSPLDGVRYNINGAPISVPMSTSSLAAWTHGTVPNAAKCTTGGVCNGYLVCKIMSRLGSATIPARIDDFIVNTSSARLTLGTTECVKGECKFTVNTSVAAFSTVESTSVNVYSDAALLAPLPFDVGYGGVTATDTMEIRCAKGLGATANDTAVSNRTLSCAAIVSTQYGGVFPLNPTCIDVINVNSANGDPMLQSATLAVGSTNALAYTFNVTLGAVGSCDGTNKDNCSFVLRTKSTCGPVISSTHNVTVQHGTPTGGNVSCGAHKLASGNVRIGATGYCTVKPYDAFGAITYGGTPQFTLSFPGGTQKVLAVVANTQNSILNASYIFPTAAAQTGTLDVSVILAGSSFSNVTTFPIVGYPSPASTFACTGTTVKTLHDLACTVTARDGGGAIYADPSDFHFIANTSAGVVVGTPKASTTLGNKQFSVNFTSGTQSGTTFLAAAASLYDTAGAMVDASTITEFSATVLSSKVTYSITFGTATAASILKCDSLAPALLTVNCAIIVYGADGRTAIDKTLTPPFAVGANSGTVSTLTTQDGGVFNFSVSSYDALTIGQSIIIKANWTGDSSQLVSSPVTLPITSGASGASTIVCSPSLIYAGGDVSCVLTALGAGSLPTLLTADIATVSATPALTISSKTAAANQRTLTINSTTPSTPLPTTYNLSVAFPLGTATQTFHVTPAIPTDATTMVCVNASGHTTATAYVGRTLTCTLNLKAEKNDTSLDHANLKASTTDGTVEIPTYEGFRKAVTIKFTPAMMPKSAQVVLEFTSHGAVSSFVSKILTVAFSAPVAQHSSMTCTPLTIKNTATSLCTVVAADAFGRITLKDTAGITVKASRGYVDSVKVNPTNHSEVLALYTPSESGIATITAIVGGVSLAPTVSVNVTTSDVTPLEVTMAFVGSQFKAGEAVAATASIALQATHNGGVNSTIQWRVDGVLQNATGLSMSVAAPMVSKVVAVQVSVVDGDAKGLATQSITYVAPPSGGRITSNVTTVVAFSDVVGLTCSGWTLATGAVTYTFMATAKLTSVSTAKVFNVIGTSTTTKLSVKAYDVSATEYACTATQQGVESVMTSTVSVNATAPSPGQQAAILGAAVLAVSDATVSPASTTEERLTFSQNVLSAASAIQNLGTGGADSVANVESVASKLNIAATIFSTALTTTEKDRFAGAVSKLSSVSTSTTAVAYYISVLQKVSTAPITFSATAQVTSAVNNLLKESLTTRRRRTLSERTSALSSAFNAAKAFLLTGGTMGTQFNLQDTKMHLYAYLGDMTTANAELVNRGSPRFTIVGTDTGLIGYVYIAFETPTTPTDVTLRVVSKQYGFTPFSTTAGSTLSSDVSFSGVPGVSGASFARVLDKTQTSSVVFNTCGQAATVSPNLRCGALTSPPAEYVALETTTPVPTPAPTPSPPTPAPSPTFILLPSEGIHEGEILMIVFVTFGGLLLVCILCCCIYRGCAKPRPPKHMPSIDDRPHVIIPMPTNTPPVTYSYRQASQQGSRSGTPMRVATNEPYSGSRVATPRAGPSTPMSRGGSVMNY